MSRKQSKALSKPNRDDRQRQLLVLAVRGGGIVRSRGAAQVRVRALADEAPDCPAVTFNAGANQVGGLLPPRPTQTP